LVTILGVNLKNNSRFISIRWKLISTYLLLVIISLIIISISSSQIISNIYLDKRKAEIYTKANIISNRVKNYLSNNNIIETKTYIDEVIGTFSDQMDSRILIIDENQIVRSDSNNRYRGQKFKHVEIMKALKGENAFGMYNFQVYGHVLYTAVPIILEDKVIGVTFISTSIEDVYKTVSQLNNKIIVISLASIILIGIIGFGIAIILSRPIEDLTKKISKMSQGNLIEKIEIKTNDEFKTLANAINLMVMKLDQVDKQRKDFVANVSHELRTPLSSMKLLAESLLHQNENNILMYREFLNDINSEVDRLNHIIDDLLTLVDLDKEKLNLNYNITYVNFWLEKIVGRLKPIAKEKSIKLKLHMEEKIQIKIDPEKMQQALINIIHNAIKYTPPGGTVKVSLYLEGKYVIISVNDNGIGIPEDSLSFIFDRFYRVDRARSRNTGGTGLGLSIAYQIVTLHQGTIEVESEVGVGSTFYIKIPYNVDYA